MATRDRRGQLPGSTQVSRPNGPSMPGERVTVRVTGAHHTMPQNTTPERLTAQQARVLERLLAGDTVTAAAKAAKVDRSTVYRWFRESLEFQAAYNEGRHQLQAATRSRLLRLTEQAVDTVEHAVENGDVRTALRLLERLGPLTPPVIGSSNVEDLEVQRMRNESARAESRWFAELEKMTAMGGNP